jgi:hypothetical protein
MRRAEARFISGGGHWGPVGFTDTLPATLVAKTVIQIAKEGEQHHTSSVRRR